MPAAGAEAISAFGMGAVEAGVAGAGFGTAVAVFTGGAAGFGGSGGAAATVGRGVDAGAVLDTAGLGFEALALDDALVGGRVLLIDGADAIVKLPPRSMSAAMAAPACRSEAEIYLSIC